MVFAPGSATCGGGALPCACVTVSCRAVATVKCSALMRSGGAPSSRRVCETVSIMSPGPQTKYSATSAGSEERGAELADMLGIQLAVVDLGLLRLAAHQKVQRQALEVAVLQGEQLLEAHRPRHLAIAVEEDGATGRPGFEPAAQNRDYGRDAAAGRKGHAGPAAAVAVVWAVKLPFGGNTSSTITGAHVLRQMSARADPRSGYARRCAAARSPGALTSRVRAPHLFARERGTQNDVLAGDAAVFGGELRGNFQSQCDGVLGLRLGLCYAQRMEFQHGIRCT